MVFICRYFFFFKEKKMVMFVIFCVQSYFIKRERVSAKMRLSSSQQTFGRGMTTLHNKVSSTSRTGVCLPAFGGLMIINAVCLLFCFLFFLNQLKCFSVTLDSRHKTGCRVVILKKKKKSFTITRNGLNWEGFTAKNALIFTE